MADRGGFEQEDTEVFILCEFCVLLFKTVPESGGNDAGALFEPILAKLDQCDAFHHAFGQRKDDAFFAFEMAPRMSDGGEQ